MSEQITEQNNSVRFADLSLSPAVQAALDAIGYEKPSPIQAQAIPIILSGRDIIGQAQTGTGKTAAFALPLLSRLDVSAKGPAALILTPTRELALQVAEAIEKYGSKIKGLSVAAIYGGTEFNKQFRALNSNPAIVVGTPGRVMDHMRRGSLDLSRIGHFILDEADEMLRMGFIDDVEWILEHTPAERQTSLFSATMPPRIAAIAKKQMRDPATVSIKAATATVEAVRQRFVQCSGMGQKLDVLANLLETEERDASIVFTRTKSAATLVADELASRGYATEAIHGDISQAKRERAVSLLKSGKVDILVATDVAARGLDVDRISHVFNFDIPDDVEPYIHRIGRTGRAGRSGEAILLVTRRDLRQLRQIETVTRQRMEAMPAPSRAELRAARQRKLIEQLQGSMTNGPLDDERASVALIMGELSCDELTVAAALLRLLQPKSASAAPSAKQSFDAPPARDAKPRRAATDGFERAERPTRARREAHFNDFGPVADDFRRQPKAREAAPLDPSNERYRIEVGHTHRVKPGNIVGAIANEAGLDSKHIGRIDIFDDYSHIDLPTGMPKEVLQLLKKTWVAGQQMRMSRVKLPS